MNRLLFSVFAIFVLSVVPIASIAGTTGVQALLDQRVSSSSGVGIIVGVIDHNGVRMYQAGSSGTTRALDSHTLFELGSVTKTFTATILSTMVLDGSVKLDDPVAKYLPAGVRVPTRNGKQITLLNLATQHSGLPRLPTNMDPEGPDPYAHYSAADLYAFLNTYRLPRDPGKSFEYSNLGVALLGDALANRAHMSYAQLLQSRVLGPLGMTETAISLTPSEATRFAAGHDADDDAVAPWNFEAIAPAGAIRSTVADMLKYVRCNMGQGPLAQACLFAQKPRATFPPGNHIGLVWWSGDLEAIVHHGGDTAGYHASVAISPDHTKGTVVLTNGGAPVDDVAVHVIDPKFPVATASFPPAVQVASATLESYVGMYEDKTDGLTFSIRHVGNSLTTQLADQPQVRMYASAQDAFYFRAVDANIAFSRSADGNVSALALHQNGHVVNATRTSAVATTPTAAPSSAPASPEPASTPQPLNANALDEYVGTYDTGQGLVFTVTRADLQLMVRVTGQEAAPVYESAKDSFYYKIVDARIDFQRDASGKVIKLVLHQNGRDLIAAKPGVPLAQPSFPPVVALDSATLDGYVGTYSASPALAFTVTRDGDRLLVQLTGQPASPVYASAKDEFYYKIVDARISFERDANGKIKDLVLHQNGRDIPAVKT
ncbi:MAG TPA: serine hydrolase [Candidatus Eremiobacteraceae bacterium]